MIRGRAGGDVVSCGDVYSPADAILHQSGTLNGGSGAASITGGGRWWGINNHGSINGGNGNGTVDAIAGGFGGIAMINRGSGSVP